MPTIYVDEPFREVVKEEVERLQREKADGDDDEVYVPERKGLEELLSDEAESRIKRRREVH